MELNKWSCKFSAVNQALLTVLYLLLFASVSTAQKINGITVVAPPKPIEDHAIHRLKDTHASWLCFVPYAFCKPGDTQVRYDLNKQWWGETSQGISKCIEMAHKSGMQVMIKPQIFAPGSWTGHINFKKNNDWVLWEAAYTKYIMDILDIVIKHNVAMFCIGTELKESCKQRPEFWSSLIADIRKKYNGKLVYSANWDEYKAVPFWKDLDYVGISAYFPLVEMKSPTPHALDAKWKKITGRLKSYSQKINKKILFTEYGYMSTDYCAWRTWETEQNVHQYDVNQEAQKTAFDALYRNVWGESYFAGGFLWKWFPQGMGHEGYKPKDYDVQDKLAEACLKAYYQQK
jgi:hypothetical protein